jgi:AraC-like DNA-binding protein
MRHAPDERLARHRHREPFAAVVLSGGYEEAGDTGRHRVRAGDVVLHRAFESHNDAFDRAGARVLVMPPPAAWASVSRGRVDDPDLLARLAERDPGEAVAALAEAFAPVAAPPIDWPDSLAQALRADPDLCLADWAAARSLHPGSVSRGFRQLYGLSPSAFRLVQRTHRALEAILRTDDPLSDVAQACGFADQAHMSRAVVRLTDIPPARLRRARGRA